MPGGVVDTARDEHKWERAKEIAAEAGKGGNYAYIMGIYKNMKPDHEFKSSVQISRLAKLASNPKTAERSLKAVRLWGEAQNALHKLDHVLSSTGSRALSKMWEASGDLAEVLIEDYGLTEEEVGY